MLTRSSVKAVVAAQPQSQSQAEMAIETYTPPPPHEIPEEAKAYVEAMSERDRALHELAVELLGSSYFVEWSHGYKKWRAAASAAKANPKQ
jgi:hypothetical protein